MFLTLQKEMNENHMVVKGWITIYSLLKDEAEVGYGLPAMATLCVVVHLGLTNFIKSKNLYWVFTMCLIPGYRLRGIEK